MAKFRHARRICHFSGRRSLCLKTKLETRLRPQTQAITLVLERITGQEVDPNGRLAGVLQATRWIQSSGFLTELDEGEPSRDLHGRSGHCVASACHAIARFSWNLVHLNGCGWSSMKGWS